MKSNRINSNKQNDKYNLLNGQTGIIYISPEYLFNSKDFIINMANKNLIWLIAVDESHCISTWGEFRPEYKELGILKEIIDAPPTDGLWDDGRTDEGQLGFSYKDLEDAMKNPDSPHKTEYEKIRKQNLHKMEPIPVCKIPS